jgi:hypothetical protein
MAGPYNWNNQANVAKVEVRLKVIYVPGSQQAQVHALHGGKGCYNGKYRHKDKGIGDLKQNVFQRYESQIRWAALFQKPFGDNDMIERLK